MASKLTLAEFDPEISALIDTELERKESSLELIPSENVVSEAVLETSGSILTDKYCEGYPGRRYYGGCEHYDTIERLAIARAKELFGAEAANVQPHSGADANNAVYLAFLKPGDKVLGLKLDHGGHLTHGSPVNASGILYDFVGYEVDEKSCLIDMDSVRKLAHEHRPKMITCGATAYSRHIDFAAFREIADEVGALLFADIAHYSGLVAAGQYPSPIPHADVVTTTTHKALRGPRGGLILCRKEHRKAINRAVFPGIQGGPLMHQVAAKAVAFKEAATDEYKAYGKQVIANARALAASLTEAGFQILTGGTDAHVMQIDLRDPKKNPDSRTGKDLEEALSLAGITCNKNTVPFDPLPFSVTSGIRIGTPAVTTRGMVEADMQKIAGFIRDAYDAIGDEAALGKVRAEVHALCVTFPLYPLRARLSPKG